jgi:hypothetical protein
MNNIYIFSAKKDFIYIEDIYKTVLFVTKNFKHIIFYEECFYYRVMFDFDYVCIKFFCNKNIVIQGLSTKSQDSIIEEKSERFILLKYKFSEKFRYSERKKIKHKLYYNKTEYI